MDDERMIMEYDGRAPRLVEALGALDPGTTDSGCWVPFPPERHERAADELARRRMMAIKDVMSGPQAQTYDSLLTHYDSRRDRRTRERSDTTGR